MPFGDGRILLEMGLKMPSKICLVVNRQNKHQNGVHIWNVSELYLSLNPNKRQNGFRVWSVSGLYLEIKSE